MKHLLVPTDFSIASENAGYFAADLASRTNALLMLHHVYIPLESPFVGSEAELQILNTEAEAGILKKLQAQKKALQEQFPDCRISTSIGESPLIEHLIHFAKQNKIDLVIMGTQGASGLRKTLIGSVSSRMIERCPIPMLFVPEKYVWKKPAHFLFASNYEASDEQAIASMIPLLDVYEASCKLVHLYESSLGARQKETERLHACMKNLELKFPNHSFTSELIEGESIVSMMEDLDEISPYDILVMVHRRKSFLQKLFISSLTKNMSYMITHPLFVLSDNK